MNKVLKEVMNKIILNGFEVYIVGGYVRDYYLNIVSTDYDLATNAKPVDLKKIFPSIKNDSYGSVVLNYKNERFEITTYRVEKKYKNNRYPIYEYTNSIDKDILRRDFTINTLYMDVDENIVDKLNGKKDIDLKTIKMVNDPVVRIKEDALRILRAIRFATIYNFKLDEDLYWAIKDLGYLVKNITNHRIKEELDKIFASKNVSYGLTLIKELGLSKYLNLDNIENIKPVNNVLGIWAQFDVIDIYPFKKIEKEQIIKIKKALVKDILNSKVLYKNGLYIATIIGEIRGIDTKIINEKYLNLPIHNISEINIKSDDILNILKIKPGKIISEIYQDLEDKILRLELENSYEQLKSYILAKYI